MISQKVTLYYTGQHSLETHNSVLYRPPYDMPEGNPELHRAP